MSLNNITISLYAANVAATAIAEMSPLLKDFPELQDPLDDLVELLNDALDQAVEDLELAAPKINGRARAQAGGIPLLSDPESAEKFREGLSSDEPETDAWEPSSPRNVSRCKALMLEIIRRAAHDWVLYRQHRKMGMRELARDAYIWLFEEKRGHQYDRERQGASFLDASGEKIKGARILTGFLSICDVLDLDPKTVRARVKKMDARSIISSGRPPQVRRPAQDVESLPECELTVNVDVERQPDSDEFVTQYEAYSSLMTPAAL